MAIRTFSSRKASKLAIAAAVMGVGAFGATAFDAPAFAQKQKAEYSDEFIKNFGPIDAAMNEENPDYAALLTQARAVAGSINTADDRMAYGSTLEKIGTKMSDPALRREGMEMMLESGKVPAAALPQYSYIAGQLAFNMEDYVVARERMQEALALGYEDPQASRLIAATYSRTDDVAGGLAYYAQQVNDQVKAGQDPSEDVLRSAFQIAADNDMADDAAAFGTLLVKYYPNDVYWANAIAIERNYTEYSESELLDLMRLLREVGAMRNARDYTDYIDAANYRRLPGEVESVTKEGLNAGLLERNDTFVSEALSEATSRAPGLQTDLAELERDAKASSADASLALATGDSFLNFNQNAKAAELYELALTRPGVDRNTALTRLGIAQVRMGDYAAAQATFDKVDGNRQGIAALWDAYASQQASGTATTTATAS